MLALAGFYTLTLIHWLLIKTESHTVIDRFVLHNETFHFLVRLQREPGCPRLPMLIHIHDELDRLAGTCDMSTSLHLVQVDQSAHVQLALNFPLVLLDDVSLELVADFQVILEEREPVASPDEVPFALSLRPVNVL